MRHILEIHVSAGTIYMHKCFYNHEKYKFTQVRYSLKYVLLCPTGVGINSGGVKYADSAGGFSYEDSGKLLSVTSNRFIHW